MIRRPPRSTLSSSSAASDVYKRQMLAGYLCIRRTPAHTMLLESAKSTSCSSIAPNTTWKACNKFWKIVTFHCFRSGSWKPLVCIRRICFRTVDLPDSPAPISQLVAPSSFPQMFSSLTKQQQLHLLRLLPLILPQLLLNLPILPRIRILLLSITETHDSCNGHSPPHATREDDGEGRGEESE